VCLTLGLQPTDLRRIWYILDRSDPQGPYWEIAFREKFC
jgi:hypothetical protein